MRDRRARRHQRPDPGERRRRRPAPAGHGPAGGRDPPRIGVSRGPVGPSTTSMAAVRAASSAVSDARRSLATEPSTDTTAGGVTDNSSRRPPSSRRSARRPPSASATDIDQTEGLGDVAMGGDQRRYRSRAAVERVVAAQHPRATGGERRERPGNGGAAQVARCVDADRAPRHPARSRRATRPRPPVVRPSRR